MKIALILFGALALLALTAMAVFVFVVQDVEQPAYRLVTRDGDLEVRDYPRLVVAEVRRPGDRREALSGGFGPLARYIFAKDRAAEGPGERISMTAPVTQQRPAVAPEETIAMTVPVTQSQDSTGDWVVRFIMPASYRLEQLPAPGGEVRLSEVAPRRVAAIRFSGRATDALLATRESELRAWLTARRLTPAAAPIYAYYNDPFTPGFLRRNEVIIDLTEPPADAEPAAGTATGTAAGTAR